MALSDAALGGRPDLSFHAAELRRELAAMVLFGLIIALAARSQLKVETS
jgi:hypothetical protein